MSRSEQPLSIEEILEMQEGDYINGPFRGVALFIETVPMTKRAGNFWKVTLGSETSRAQLPFSMFTAPKFRAKDVIEISGQGNKVKLFNGQPEVSIGRAAEIHVVTSAPPERHAPPARRPAQDDSRGSPPAGESAPPASAPPSDDNSPHGANPIPGQEVGMALKEALLLVPRAYASAGKLTFEDLDSPLFWRRVHVAASDILRVSTMLRRGSVAPNVVERMTPPQNPPPAAKETPPKAAEKPAERHTPPRNVTPPRGNKAPADGPHDDDVPF